MITLSAPREGSETSTPPVPSVEAGGTRNGSALQDVSHDQEKGYPPPSDDERGRDTYLVDWEPNDPNNPRNWKTAYKSFLTFQLGMLALAASLGSSIISPAEDAIAEYAGVSPQVATLSLSLYILGFAFGPLLWAPISEVWGRKWSMLPAMFCLGLFSIGTATSPTPAAIFITRFFGGVFGSAPVSNVSAALGDIWEPKARGTAVTFYALCVTGGPTLGPGTSGPSTRQVGHSLIDACSHWLISHHYTRPWLALDRIYRSHLGILDFRPRPFCTSRTLRACTSKAQSC